MSQTLDIALPSSQSVTRESFPGHVLAEITRTSGPQPPAARAVETLEEFWDRIGPDKALMVCSLVFGRHRGYWRGAPVSPARFAPHMDDFFALAVLEAGGE
jgi:hypothetical protein